MTDKNGRLYFEYGVMSERVFLDDIAFAAQHIVSVLSWPAYGRDTLTANISGLGATTLTSCETRKAISIPA